MSWDDWPPARPIRVDGGIRARSRRGAIGEQWWSRRFIGVLESYGMSGRLARGRNYARAGQVLDFELSQGKVTARVQGSRVRPYQVRIGVLPLTTAQWRRVLQKLAGQALFRAKLLAGEMPHEIEEVFAECGTPLFPRSAADLDMHCSCPDWEVPCKHLAAVCYVLAEEFDRDPFGMLAWRGKGRDELLASLRRIQGSASPPGGPAGSAGPSGPSGTSRAALDVPAPPLEECLDGFWSPGLSPARLRALAATPQPAAPDLLLRMFPPPPVKVRGKDLADVLAPAYQRLAADDPEPGEQASTAGLPAAVDPSSVVVVLAATRKRRKPTRRVPAAGARTTGHCFNSARYRGQLPCANHGVTVHDDVTMSGNRGKTDGGLVICAFQLTNERWSLATVKDR